MNRSRHVLQALLVCIVVITELVPAFSGGPVTIAVVFSRDIAPYRDALKGFEAGLSAANGQFRFVEFNAETAELNPAGLLERIRAKRPALILTLGSAATKVVASVTETPVVFSLVMPSTGNASLEELRATHENIAGASMQIPIQRQFAKIRELLPAARRIGVLFDPDISSAQVEAAKKVAAEMGLEIVPLPVKSESDVVERMDDVEGHIDLLWSVADSTVFTPQGLRHILLSTLRSRIPFVGLSPSFVKAGALLALSCSYEDVGRQSGEIAARILSGEEPSRIPTAVPREVSLSVNLNTAKQIALAISDQIRRSAEVFF